MRQEGELRRWDDARGFGFIRVGSNQPDIFVHISAFEQGVRPQAGDLILFDGVVQEGGKGPRAIGALVKGRSADAPSDPVQPRRRLVGKPRQQAQPTAAPGERRNLGLQALRWSPGVILVLTLAGFCLVGAASFLPHSPIPFLLYLVTSTLAFILYGKDKYRAIQGTWRISEGTLHLVEALGGWPGAFLAQRMMRHKTVKLSYQAAFWLIVAAHVGFWGLWFLGPDAVTAILGWAASGYSTGFS
jgi:uncharacterized membrane protein YsdA (DUF1294 family)/cold shock CspA family protein